MNKVEKAVEIFRKPYSCAQAVAVAFNENISQEELDVLKANSGGKAPDGICGALYAACQILKDTKGTCEIFQEKAGMIQCRELKTKGKVPCEDCVKIAAQIVEDSLNK